MPIRLLPPTVVHRIAAGEVVERPAAAVKELVENALDAGASNINVSIVDGGRALISVVDDGSGMEAGEMLMAVERHATSKLPGDDLTRVTSLGFRGEALPAIGAVARLTLTSRCRGADSAWNLSVTASRRGDVVPVAHPPGTRVEVRDLFFATPARLNFLKPTRAEAYYVRDILERLALAHPMVNFTLSADGRSVLQVQAVAADLDRKERHTARLVRLMGRAFVDNAVSFTEEHDGMALDGFISLPPFAKKTTSSQYFFVNGRPIHDRLLGAAVRKAYQEGGFKYYSHPLVCLFLNIAPERIDINVHPTKAEVRFRDAEAVRNLLLAALRHALSCRPTKTARAAVAFGTCNIKKSNILNHPMKTPIKKSRVLGEESGQILEFSASEKQTLGRALAQIHSTYIIAETPESLIIVDQYAAYEFLIFEHLWATCKEKNVRQKRMLSIPKRVNLQKNIVDALVSRAEELAETGVLIEAFGSESVVVRAIPTCLEEVDVQGLLQALGDGLGNWDVALDLQERLYHVCRIMASFYCCSVSLGFLTVDKMNALLRQIEEKLWTAHSSQSRLTYMEWKIKDLEKLFHRC